MKRPDEMNDEEFGGSVDDLSCGIVHGTEAEWKSEFGRRVRVFLADSQPKPVPSDLADLRAEVSRTAAMVQALATARGLSDPDVHLVDDSLGTAINRLIDLRARQAKLDPVLSGEDAK